MIVIEIFSRRYDPQERQIVVEPAARIQVDEAHLVVVEGDPGWIHLQDIVLNHPETKEDLTFDSDPDLWAETLPEAFRTGDTFVEVERAGQPVAASAFAVAERTQAGWR